MSDRLDPPLLSRLKELLSYDKATGLFTWRVDRIKVKAGDIAGCLDHGYVRIRIDGVCYKAHRLAWYYQTSEWPEDVDHRNWIRNDNRFENLRSATASKNLANTRRKSNNTSGYKGVSWHKQRQTWRATCATKHIGLFDDPIEAAKAYDAAARELFGEFAHTNF